MSTVRNSFAQSGQGPIHRQRTCPGSACGSSPAPASRRPSTARPSTRPRVKNRSAKNTYVVADGVEVGVMQQADRSASARRRRSAGPGGPRRDGPDPGGPPHGATRPRSTLRCRLFVPEGLRPHRLHVAQHALPSDSSYEPDFVSGLRARLAGAADLLRRQPGLHVHPRDRTTRARPKKSMLRQAMYWIKRRGGLGLHAGSKILRVDGTGRRAPRRRVPPLRALRDRARRP